MKQYAFFFDSSSCSGCKACQMACKDKHDLAQGIMWRKVYDIAGGEWEKKNDSWISKVFSYNLSISCNHCENPACLKGCPTSAIQKREDGIVSIDQGKCMGCKYCSWLCPYSAPQYNSKKGIMEKCDFCRDYIEQGLPPSCVAACPMRVLDFGDINEMRVKYTIKEIFPLPDPELTKPALRIKVHKDTAKANQSNAEIVNKEEVNYVRS